MTGHDDLERTLARWFEADALGPAPPGRLQEAIGATRTLRPRRAALARFGSGWVETWPASDTPRVAWGAVAVLVLILLALAAGAIYVGSQPRRPPAVVGPAGNGLIAYSSAGDIYVGDPQTGTTTAIVSDPEHDVRPVYSPDGSRIAFIRVESADVHKPVAVVVVRPDGTDRRVITPDGFGRFFDFLAWTPDGTGIVLNYEHGVAILDAEGVAELQNLSPPLRKWPGAGYFNANDQVAAMFRPPTGDRILSYGSGVVREHDSDGTFLRELVGPSRTDVGFYYSSWPAWSPDASKIAFGGLNGDEGHIYVMNADGSDVRLVGREGSTHAWSPEGSRIAFERYSTIGSGPEPGQAVIVIVDVESGAERVLEATSVGRKGETNPPRAWVYEGWSWSPDGGSVVFLERRGDRPKVVDVQTGEATALPWEADSPASWQRVAPGDSR